MDTVNTPGARFKHEQVREYVRSLALAAEPGAHAPSERELVQRFNVARMTVRHAMDGLVAQGLLERIPGRGTFVAKPHVEMQSRLSSFTEEMKRRGRKPGSSTMQRTRRRAGPGVARAMQIEEGEPVGYWRRLRTADGVPVCICDVYFSLEHFDHLLSGAEPSSLYSWFAERDLLPTWGEDSVVAAVATAEEAEILQIEEGSAVLRVSRRAFCREVVCEVSRSTYRADQFTLWVPVLRSDPGGA
ncbi:GntR family transcriptional regulator [Marmoricola endophyticus]|uniref:GntR family transcriptional regulator n=1 Tax=Marmoricola endophyticus TaxID=2040280 RepID=A0A917F6E4_9ACTN|nr:GntR family transcriptional regulator [Marmoricola endophyticus]GGF53810.1 GntR family transcriptional regulator [Marmoricola endophyticus]